jgi:8-oxo-dGTP pyrophosphatase MutT (NUDIX family)
MMGDMRADKLERTVRAALQSGARRTIEEPGYAPAAVLLPLVYRGAEPDVLLTRRTDLVETHKGQISLPGGVSDFRDRSRIETALRETHEELGIPATMVETLGVLDDIQTPTGFIITPVVGLLRSLPPLAPSQDEVAEVLFVPLMVFADHTRARKEYRNVQGVMREVWFYEYGGHTIWGATAAIIRTFLQKVQLDTGVGRRTDANYPA